MYLQQPGLMYSASGSLKKNKERIKKSKDTGDLRYIFMKMNSIKLVLNMIWFLEILNI